MRSLVPALLLALVAAPAAAHRGHDFLTVVTLGDDGTVTVSHRFEAADIEPALLIIAPDAQPSLDDPVAVNGLQAYLARRFSVSAGRSPIALTPGKVDMDAQEVRVSFVGHVPAKTPALTIRSTVLDDVYQHQANQVNVRKGRVVRTLAVSDGEPQTVRF